MTPPTPGPRRTRLPRAQRNPLRDAAVRLAHAAHDAVHSLDGTTSPRSYAAPDFPAALAAVRDALARAERLAARPPTAAAAAAANARTATTRNLTLDLVRAALDAQSIAGRLARPGGPTTLNAALHQLRGIADQLEQTGAAQLEQTVPYATPPATRRPGGSR